MSTRGYYGIRKKSELKGAYNHFDSYISGLGVDLAKIINNIEESKREEVLNETYDYIQLIKENSTPTQEQIDTCKKLGLADMSVSSGADTDWYCLLRNTQGNLQTYIDKKCPYMLDGNDFLDNDLFCEYAYIVDLDTNTFNIYVNGKHLIKKYPLNNIDIEDMLSIEEN